MKSVLAVMCLLALEASAFWRLPCRHRLVMDRVDPIKMPGLAADHMHTIHGGSGFNSIATTEDLLSSDCSSCQVKGDNSVYWTAQVYWQSDDGEFTALNQTGGMLAYYLQRVGSGQVADLKPFPSGFRMIAGDPDLRNFTWPDVQKSLWTVKNPDGSPGSGSQEAMRQKAVGFNCLNYDEPTTGALSLQAFPDNTKRCKDGLRAEVFFPSCWNGQDVDTDDHRSHMAYPTTLDDGECPTGFETRLPSLFYETIWDVDVFWGQGGQFVFSMGDPTGYGNHGDFMNGWDQDLLKSAIHTCTNESGEVQDCPLFDLRTEDEMAQCSVKPEVNEDRIGPMSKLPGCNPVMSGPAPVSQTSCSLDYMLNGSGAVPKPTSSAEVTPTAAATSSIKAKITSAASSTTSLSVSSSVAIESATHQSKEAANTVSPAAASTSSTPTPTTLLTSSTATAVSESSPSDVIVTVTSYTTAAPVIKTVEAPVETETVQAPEVVETVTAAAMRRHLHHHHHRRSSF